MITTEALSRTYGDVVAVDNVSFTIGKSEIVGLLGHNGAGKTTIMKMITGFIEPTSGEITVDGLDIRTNRAEIQERIGYLPENCPLYTDMNVLDFLDYRANLKGLSGKDKTSAIATAIARTNLGSVAEKPVSTLSRGFRQRLGVAQAILRQPRILILDEPTNGLDPSQIQEMRHLIKELASTATVVVSTHILQEVQATCHRVIIVAGGKIALDSSMEKLGSASRLTVAVDAEPAKFEPLLKEIEGLEMTRTEERDRRHQYLLLLQDGLESGAVLPEIARRTVEAGFKLYRLEESGRDLETVFGEISGGRGEAGND